MKKAIWVFFLLFLAGCQTVPPPNTASGKPEVTINEASPEKVKPALVTQMVNAGYRITKDTQYELAFDKPVQNVVAQVLLGSRYDSQPNARVSFAFAPIGGSTRVIADFAVITNPGSGFERRTEMNAGVDSYDIQVLLDAVRASLDPSAPAAIAQRNGVLLGIGVTSAARAKISGQQGPDKGLYIMNVTPGGVADKVGLKKGDVILDFAGRTTNSQEQLSVAQAETPSGSTAKLNVWRDGAEEQISVTFPSTQKAQSKSMVQEKKKTKT